MCGLCCLCDCELGACLSSDHEERECTRDCGVWLSHGERNYGALVKVINIVINIIDTWYTS